MTGDLFIMLRCISITITLKGESMKTIFVRNWRVELDYEPMNEEALKNELSMLLENHIYNSNTNWETVRNRERWRKRKQD